MFMVQLALRRPYTFIVMAMLIVLATPFALWNMATAIFPEINIPVISIIWNYNGLPAQRAQPHHPIGASLVQPIFDAGRTDANVSFARSGFDAAVANYRRVVLTAMQEVEDGITGSAALDRALTQAQRATASSERVLQLANDRYEGGATGYLDVVTAQQSLLASQRQEAQLLGQRLLVSVFLVKALGGDWNP